MDTLLVETEITDQALDKLLFRACKNWKWQHVSEEATDFLTEKGELIALIFYKNYHPIGRRVFLPEGGK